MAYRALLSLLADPDPAMQLAAVASLHALIDDWSVSWLVAHVHFPRLRMLCFAVGLFGPELSITPSSDLLSDCLKGLV